MLALCMLALGAPASAQPYRCTDGARVTWSDRPCPGAPTGTLRALGPPAAPEARARPYAPPAGSPPPKASEHIGYLSPACASLSEAIRTGPSRGVTRAVVNDLQNEYQQKCVEEDRFARQRASEQTQSEREKQRSVLEARNAEGAARQRSQEACMGMRDAIQSRNRHLNPQNAAEVNALADLQRRFDAECVRR